MINKLENQKLALAILVLVTAAVYLVCLRNGFVWDDDYIIVKNPATVHLSGIADLIFSPDVVKPYYRPLNRVSYLINFWLCGMNPAGFHAVNLLLHLANVALLYLVGCRVASSRVAAFAAALLFGIHPVNAESVDFVSARNNLLACAFSLGALLLLVKSRKKEGGKLWASALLFLLGVLSKETAFMLLGFLILCTLYPFSWTRCATWREREGRLAPYLVAAALYLAMRFYALKGLVGAASSTEPLFTRLALNFYSIPHYIGWFLFPADLTIFHAVPTGGYYSHTLLIAWVALVALLAGALRRRSEPVLFALIWIAVNLIPIANIIPIPSAAMAERYLYLPSVGVCLLAGEGIAALERDVARRSLAWGALLALVVFFAPFTVLRTLEWRDEFSLFGSAVKNNPLSAKSHFNLGNALKDRGDLAGARREWERTLELDRRYLEGYTQLGTLSAVQGDFMSAERYYLAALGVDPQNAMAHFNLGKLYTLVKMPERALSHLEMALPRLPVEYEEYRPEIEARIARLRVGTSGAPAR